MCEVAAHLTDHVLPHVPTRQWVLSVPKRLLDQTPAVDHSQPDPVPDFEFDQSVPDEFDP
jgi:hypothetical protein